MSKFVGCFILLTSLYATTVRAQGPQAAPEMLSLAKAFEGRWTISEKYEPDEWTPNGGVGDGEEVWRRGPGGFTFMEEVHDKGPAGESFGLALSWWDKEKGFQGVWCESHNPQGCAIGRDINGSFKWDGKQQVVDNEFQRNGKTGSALVLRLHGL